MPSSMNTARSVAGVMTTYIHNVVPTRWLLPSSTSPTQPSGPGRYPDAVERRAGAHARWAAPPSRDRRSRRPRPQDVPRAHACRCHAPAKAMPDSGATRQPDSAPARRRPSHAPAHVIGEPARRLAGGFSQPAAGRPAPHASPAVGCSPHPRRAACQAASSAAGPQVRRLRTTIRTATRTMTIVRHSNSSY